jgi:hypothetical protein
VEAEVIQAGERRSAARIGLNLHGDGLLPGTTQPLPISVSGFPSGVWEKGSAEGLVELNEARGTFIHSYFPSA